MTEMLVYSPPDAASIDGAQIDDIIHCILNEDAKYWSAGMASAAIYYGKQGGWSPKFVLLLTKFGFYVEAIVTETIKGRKKRVTYVPNTNLGRLEVDEPWAGQNPMRIPKDFCLSREQCAEAVRYFCETGERDPRINWVNSALSGWDTNVDH